MSEFRSEGVAQSTPHYIPAADALTKSRIPPAWTNGHASTPLGRQHSPQTHSEAPGTLPTPDDLLASTLRLADEIAARPNHGEITLPREDLRRLADLGLLLAPLPSSQGGLGLGTEPTGHLILLRILAAIGGADLVLAASTKDTSTLSSLSPPTAPPSKSPVPPRTAATDAGSASGTPAPRIPSSSTPDPPPEPSS